MQKTEYGLSTAIAMIVGVVIGSGIFFKSDNILVATDGSIALGVLVFILAAISIIFGGLTMSELASRYNKPGGIISYAEHSNKSIGCALGWFHTLIYYPTLVAIVSWVAGIYIFILFGIESTLLYQCLVGLICFTGIFVLNILSTRLGGYFQNASTIVKLVPLISIAILGLIYGDPLSSVHLTDVTQMTSLGWMSAISAIAFSFDGWIIATSLGGEIKNSKKNLPIALIFAPIFILIIYVLYFVGISSLVGPETVMAQADAHVDTAANLLFGPFGAKIVLIFVIISVLGTVNGLTMAIIRMPQMLSERNMFPNAKKMVKINPKYRVSIPSAIFGFLISAFWLVVHYICTTNNLLPNSDISEISISINYIAYIYLYYQVIKLKKSGEIKSAIRGYFNPIMACIGSLIIVSGSIGNPLFILYLGISAVIAISAIIYYKKVNE
ncbi:amino acid permease [Candidatus Epulonipiscium fishelsonii]|uniref:Amino acid permease n=1 Tax=Candidatus Epulonipiscium fishelsonii TaxID=77094 RepID=A0ACC8XAN9_9FIRM|nr:amino acid permease [Epulopiscium sp. SCG-D08WGA-EpuloA1]